jgi:glycosyltransferase involved in cell wall biosynthesis
LKKIALIVPYYRNPLMLEYQYEVWSKYSDDAKAVFEIIVVDDGSPEPAADVRRMRDTPELRIFRIDRDIEWNQHGARNLGAHEAQTTWLLMTDIDHVLTAEGADVIAAMDLSESDGNMFYTFPRVRIGKADETRLKHAGNGEDAEAERVDVKPHINTFMVRRSVYWLSGGYDEDYCGCLCGDGEFVKRMKPLAETRLLEEPMLEVHTRHSVADANTTTLSRGKDQSAECRRRIRQKKLSGNTVPIKPMRFGWDRTF